MREILDWITDNAGTIVPVLGGAAIILCGGAIGAACAGYYAAAGVAGGLGLVSGIGAGATRIVEQSRIIEQFDERERAQTRERQRFENLYMQELHNSRQLLTVNQGQAQTVVAQRRQIEQLTTQRDRCQTQMETLQEERNVARQTMTDQSFEIRRINQALIQVQNERDRLNTRITELERQDRLHINPPPRENIRVSPIPAGTFAPRPVHRRTRNDDEQAHGFAFG
jgi:hypothetical protein